MKKTYLKSAIVGVGFLAGTLIVEAQTAGGGTASGTAAGTAAPGTATTAPATRSTARPGPARPVGASGITQPPATPPVGGSSVVGTTPSTVGGTPTTTLSPGVATMPQGVATTALPAPVQTVLQSFTASGTLGSVSQVQGVNGPVYQATVTQNGVPVELQIAQNGQILSRTVGAVGTGPVTAAGSGATATATAATGLALSALPQPVQSSIAAQLGPNAQVQSISRDDLANGTVFRVTTTQNGVPTEMRFAANGTLLGSAVVSGTTATTPIVSGGTVVGGGVVPGTGVTMESLPAAVQAAIRGQVGAGRLRQITQQQGTNGVSYAVSYDLNGQPMMMVMSADGRVLSNAPIGASSPARVAAATNAPRSTTSSSRTALKLQDLPDPVQRTLKREAQGAEIRSITREQRVGGDVYTISVRGENSVGDLTIGATGNIVNDTRRDVAAVSVPKTEFDEDKVVGLPYNTMPIAIKNAVQAYASAAEIRSILLVNDTDTKPVYEVIYYRDGRRDRMFVTKDGTLRRIEHNVSPAVELTDSTKRPMLAIGDLPQPVQDTIRRQTETTTVKDIGTKKVGPETVYQVHYETNGSPVELLIAFDGRVVLPEGATDANAPLPAPLSKEERSTAKVVSTTAPEGLPPVTNLRVESTGAAGGAERGTVESPGNPAAPGAEPAKVSIADVPAPVQKTAKTLAGIATIESITPRLSDAGVTYEVSFMQNGVRKTVLVNKDGVVVNQ